MKILNLILDGFLNLLACACVLCALPPAAAATSFFLLGRFTQDLIKSSHARENS
ncbi:MAG: hypothetical protein V4726_05735 [Verrucomicrobiota bacterium]